MIEPLITLFIRCPEPQRHGSTGQRSRFLWAVKKRLRESLYDDLDAQLRTKPGWKDLVLASPTKRRVVFTRGLGKAVEPASDCKSYFRAYDLGNYLSALKQVEDVLQRPRPKRPGIGLIWDDNPKWMAAEYVQEKCEVSAGTLRIRVYEMEPIQ